MEIVWFFISRPSFQYEVEESIEETSIVWQGYFGQLVEVVLNEKSPVVGGCQLMFYNQGLTKNLRCSGDFRAKASVSLCQRWCDSLVGVTEPKPRKRTINFERT